MYPPSTASSARCSSRGFLPFVILFTIKMVCPASAMVGGAREIPAAQSQPEVMFVGSGGNFCTGTMIVADLVLTAAHCIHRVTATSSSRPAPTQAEFKDVAVASHPQFNLKTMLAHRATADVALMKLKTPHAGYIAPLLPARPRVTVGERFVVRGYGATMRGRRQQRRSPAGGDARRDRQAR